MQRRDIRPSALLFRLPIRSARILLPVLIEPVTTPRPQLRRRHQPALHRIPVHVIELLDPLLRAPHVEIIKTPLPETPRRIRRRLGPQSHLILIRSLPPLSSQALRHALLQNLHHRGRRAHFRLRNQQMNVLRHHHVPNQQELITLAHLIQDSQERIPLPRRSEQGSPPITTTRDEVQVFLAIPPLQFVAHRLGHSCAPSPAARVRHPELQKQQQTQKLINFHVNYRSGIIRFRHASIATAQTQEIDGSTKGRPPAWPKILAVHVGEC